MTHLKMAKIIPFLLVLHWAVDVIGVMAQCRTRNRIFFAVFEPASFYDMY